MIWSTIRRIFKGGFLNFWRNGVVSLSSILVMVIALFMIGSTILISAFLNSALTNIREKVDVNVYIVPGSTEDSITALKADLEALPEVSFVEYVSQDEVLADFRTKHQDDQLTLQALDEIGGNPFGAILNVKAVEPSQYGSVENFLSDESALEAKGVSIVDHTNYNQNKIAIERLSSLVEGIQKMGLGVTATLIVISILITFNTIRLAIYTSREEIAVMRLVGARNSYVRGPFVIEGILYGLVAGLIAIALFYPITLWLKSSTQSLYDGIDLFQYYIANFAEIFLVIVASGILLGAISSYLAVRKYLRV